MGEAMVQNFGGGFCERLFNVKQCNYDVFFSCLWHTEWPKYQLTERNVNGLVTAAVQYSSTGLLNTTLLWLYKCHCCGHVMSCNMLAPVLQFSSVILYGCLFRKCNKCLLSNITGYLYLLWLPEWAYRYISWFFLPNKSTGSHMCISNITTELFNSLDWTWWKEWMCVSLNVVGISNT